MDIKDEIIKRVDKIERELKEGHDVVIKITREGVTVQALSIKKIN